MTPIVRLGSVARIDRENIDPAEIASGTQYVGLEHIGPDGSLATAPTIEPGVLASTKFRFSGHHILFGKLRPYLRKVALPNFSGICSTDILPISPSANIDRSYLYHFLRADETTQRVAALATGINLPRLSPTDLLNLEVPLPSLEHQGRIAAILDECSSLCDKAFQAIDVVDHLIETWYAEACACEPKANLVPFEQAAIFQEGPGVRNWQFRDSGIKLINVKNIVNGNLDITNTDRYLDAGEVNNKYKHFLLNAGDLVMASSGVTWGKVAEVDESDLPLCLNTSIIRVRPRDQEFRKCYIRCFIEFGSFRPQIDRLITGSAQPNFGPSHLRQVVIPKLSMDTQRALESRVSGANRLRQSLLERSMTLRHLAMSMEHAAFSGAILVKSEQSQGETLMV